MPLQKEDDQQKRSFSSLDELAEFLELTEEQKKSLSVSSFPLLVPYRLAAKMEKGSIDDPLFRQFVCFAEEKRPEVGFVKDPVQDRTFSQSTRLLQKYERRVLLLVSGSCPLHCRFCFRQNYDYQSFAKGYEKELAIIQQDESIQEVIFSGGDPLSVSNSRLQQLLAAIDLIPHIARVRFHTRFPIAFPERLDKEFVQILSSLRCQVYFVVHANHPKELDCDVLQALSSLQVPLLLQTVLLQGINDQVAVLQELFETAVNAGILPYYLHQLDPVFGAHRFHVSEDKGKMLIAELAKTTSGYAIPRYVREDPGLSAKTVIAT